MTVQNFNADESIAEAWWDMKRSLWQKISPAQPNPAHKFFAILQERGQLRGVITQNIDSLHEKAGVPKEKIIELHGHMRGLICSNKKMPLNPMPFGDGKCTHVVAERSHAKVDAIYGGNALPRCTQCAAPLRSEVVMFGQPIPQALCDEAREVVAGADLLVVVGSTLLVSPANQLPGLALRLGIPLVVINFDDTKYDGYATALVRRKAGEFLDGVARSMSLSAPAADEAPGESVFKAEMSNSLAPATDAVRKRAISEAERCARLMLSTERSHGICFTCQELRECDGDVNLMQACGEVIQATTNHLGKMLFSCSVTQLVMNAYLPATARDRLSCETWLAEVVAAAGAGQVLWAGDMEGIAVLEADKAREVSPIKAKDACINAAVRVLRVRGMLSAEDSEEEALFSFDDFPSS